ncbi:MAG: TetR/AcrR family transcriptional regulator [Cyclobacteriaceae bacterium]|nr:TetR/AcrR family transcriptional regulator [Cyclobacteriaceae bacterium]
MRQHIILEARRIFNKEGLYLTLEQLASRLELSKGRITNYFPTKDNLFVAISQDYDLRFQELMISFSGVQKVSFEWLKSVCSAVMDLQYQYRSAIVFVATTSSSQTEMHNQITKSYKKNSQQVRKTVALLVENGLLKPELLELPNFEVFCFQHVNLFTTWVISLEIYHSSSSYKKMKPVYLKGIVGCYYPYLTKKGQTQYQALHFK